MLSEDSPLGIYERAGQIIGEAARVVANIEQLSLADVNMFLEKQLRADVVFEELPENLAGNHSRAKNNLEKSLSTWDTDRTNALLHLLHYVIGSRERGATDIANTFARCSEALLQEPLIPSLSPEKYIDASNMAGKALANAVKEKNDSVNILTIYFTGVTYNAYVFCPEIYQEEITSKNVEQVRRIFQNNLRIIQGKDQL